MDDLLDTVAESYPVNLEDIQPLTQTSKIPEASIRNQAALTAMLSNDPLQTYQIVKAETEQGVSYTRDMVINSAKNRQAGSDKQALMSILADPSITIEQKKAVIAGLNTDFHNDTSTLVAHASASLPNKTESVEAEDVRIIGVEQYRAIREAREKKQQMLNREYVKLNAATGKAASDIAEMALAPFAVNKAAYGVLTDILSELGFKDSRIKTALTPGSAIEKIREKLATIPPEDRPVVEEKISNIIFNTPNIVFSKDNDFAKFSLSQAIFQEGGYSAVDKWLDNASGLLDIIGVGTLAKSGIRKITSLTTKTPEVETANMKLRNITSTSSPVSPVKIVEDTNPERARSLYEMVVKSSGDEVAQTITGTSRQDFIAESHIPQPLSKDGSVEAKLVEPDRYISPDPEIVREWENTGGLWITDKERKQVGANLFNKFTDVKGITPLDNMVAVGVVGDKAIIKAMYGTSDGGFLKAEDALDQVKLSLREFGIDDRDLTLMKKIGDEYVPITLAEAKGVDGNYLVQLNTKHTINATDIVEFDKVDVKRNWFDAIPYLRSKNSGTIANSILDNASMLHPVYSGGAVVQADKAVRIDKLFLELHSEFSDAYLKLNKARQDKVYDYIREANHFGLELNANQLLARGFVKDEIDVINTWKRNWDTHFWFENADLVRTLNHQGFKVFENQQTGTKLFAKEIPKNQNIGKVYDPALDQVVTLSKQDLDNLYTSGGSYAALRRPVDFNGTTVEHMIVRNTPTEYLRGLRDFDQVLNYRKGYYQVQYKAPKFIEETIRDANGNELYKKAVSVAGDTKEAEHIRKRLAATTGKDINDFRVREDFKKMRVDTDAYWDLQNASGRIAQRHRGKRLENTSSPIGGFDTQYILDPVESAVRASRSLSGRIATRDFLEISKARAMSQYSDYFPSNGKGGKQWVENSNSLLPTTSATTLDIGSARTTVEYLNYLQHGYSNSADLFFKSMMNGIANMLAGTKAEKMFLWAGESTPTEFLKSGVFQAYIALNPLRQLVIQSHQTIRLLGYNPIYMGSGQVMLDGEKVFRYLSGLSDINKADKETKELVRYVQDSGMLDAVDKQNLVRGSLSQLTESSNRVKRFIGTAISIPRKFGFDIGEQSNLLTHLLAVRDRFIKSGKNLSDPLVRDEAYSQVRAMTYDMNFAGDMPYNQNALGLFMQFFQVPHKAFLQYTNRRIPPGDRLRMAMVDAILFGIPGAMALENLIGKEMLPEDAKAREGVLFGLTSVAYNGAMSKIAGEDVKVDFSQLSPYGIEGFAHLAHAIVSGGTLEFIQNSPAFTMYLKDGSRVQEAFGRMFRYFGFIDTQEGLEKEDALSVLSGVAEISSGWTNAMKAATIIELGKIPNKGGDGVLIDDPHWFYAAAQLFGFKSQKEILEWKALSELRDNKKSREEEYQKFYDSYVRVLTRDHKLKISDPESVVKVLGAAKLMYKDDFKAQEWIANKLSRDMVDKQDTLTRYIIEAGNFPDAGKTLSNTRTLMTDPEYENVKRLFEDMQKQINKKEE